jgi:ubiquinone/menaquinone biosynthesis C-methylase UbiE
LQAHYAPGDLLAAILDGLRAAGLDLERLDPAALFPLDQFHGGGRDATLDLARAAALRPGQEVVDLGGGIGGPARILASEFGCRVTVLDLTEEFCRTGRELTRLTGLADKVAFRHGSALEAPFADQSFDVVWTQHSSMNIEDKRSLYREAFRLLRPGGRLAFHEILAGPGGELHWPVPWARDASLSFLATPAETRDALGAAGFRELEWCDVSREALAWFRARVAAIEAGPPPALSLRIQIGRDLPAMMRNLAWNYEEARVLGALSVWTRP